MYREERVNLLCTILSPFHVCNDMFPPVHQLGSADGKKLIVETFVSAKPILETMAHHQNNIQPILLDLKETW